MAMLTLKDDDFYTWTQEQAAILRRAAELRLNAPEGADWLALADEVWELGLSLENELYARYVVLLLHLLKWRYQPEARGGSWRGSINEQRRRIARLLRRNPGLGPKRPAEFAEAFAEARHRASEESGLPLSFFPAGCPFALDDAECPDYWPSSIVDEPDRPS